MSLLHLSKSKSFLLLTATLLLTKISVAQTTIINSANGSGTSGADGSFENTSFANNGWDVVNGASNNWYSGNFSSCVGSRAAYIGTASTNNNYNTTATSISHLYKDVTFPAGQSCITLSFTYKGQGENGYDGLRVYLGSAAVTPVAGTRFIDSDGTAVQLGSNWYNLASSCTNVSITISGTNAGTTKRLVFSWENDFTDGTSPAITLDNVSLTTQSQVVPSCVSLTSPANGATGISICDDLVWAASTGTGCSSTDQYEIYFGNTATPPLYATINSGTTSFQPPTAPGYTYYWQIRPRNGAGAATGCPIRSFTTSNPIPGANYALAGSATSASPYNCVTLTTSAGNQNGCAWDINSTLDFLNNFSYDIDINMGSSDAGADGMAFVIHNDPQGRCKCGTAGGSLGAGGILNSVIIEIDTYTNFEDRDDFVSPFLGDPNTEDPDHLDIWINGNVNPNLDGNANALAPGERPAVPNAVRLQNPPGTNYNIENGATHKFRISWNSTTNTLTASIFNSALTINYGSISYSFNPITLFGTSSPYFGYTAATGALANNQSFCLPATFLPVELSVFEAVCSGTETKVYWKSEFEPGTEGYIVEKSCDGINFEAFTTEDAGGKSMYYTVTDSKPCENVTYYRLSEKDRNGTIKVLGIRSVNPCGERDNILVYPSPADDKITVVLNSRTITSIAIKNSIGQAIFDQEVSSKDPLHFDVSQLASGVYFIIATDGEKTEAVKFIVQ